MFFDKAVQIAPNNSEAYLNRGAIRCFLHDYKQAIADEKRASEIAKNNRDLETQSFAHQNLAGIYLNTKQFDKAEVEARIGVQLYPLGALAQKMLGNVLLQNGKSNEGIVRLKRAKELYELHGSTKQAEEINKQIIQLQSKRALNN